MYQFSFFTKNSLRLKTFIVIYCSFPEICHMVAGVDCDIDLGWTVERLRQL